MIKDKIRFFILIWFLRRNKNTIIYTIMDKRLVFIEPHKLIGNQKSIEIIATSCNEPIIV